MQKIEEYQALALRTAKDMGSIENNLVHAALGIGSEAGELSETIVAAWLNLPYVMDNLSEELGDCAWFAALMCSVMSWNFEDLILEPAEASDLSNELAAAVLRRNPPALVMCLSAFAGGVLTVVKAGVVYGKEMDVVELKRKLSLYVTTIGLISDIHDIPFVQFTLAANIAKLQKRYPEKYSDAAAIERKDKK
jgi:NTP pyrophosphatase (non-canonical NTP hydrolase)